MDGKMLKQMLIDIKEECENNDDCSSCHLYAGEKHSTMCMLDAQSDIYSNPSEWDIDVLMNLKSE